MNEKQRQRIGKTKKDREQGAAARNAANKAERAAYYKDDKAKPFDFPSHTCNGKKTRALRKAAQRKGTK